MHEGRHWGRGNPFSLASDTGRRNQKSKFCHLQILLQHQLLQHNVPSVRQQLCWATSSPGSAHGHCTGSLCCYSPSCLTRCFLLHRPPCQGQAGQSHQNTLCPPQKSIQSWLVSCKERLQQKIQPLIICYRPHLITHTHRLNSAYSSSLHSKFTY